VTLTFTTRWQIPAAPSPRGNLLFLRATWMPLLTSHTTSSTPSWSTRASRLTLSQDLPFWTWPLRIPLSPPLSRHGTHPPLQWLRPRPVCGHTKTTRNYASPPHSALDPPRPARSREGAGCLHPPTLRGKAHAQLSE